MGSSNKTTELITTRRSAELGVEVDSVEVGWWLRLQGSLPFEAFVLGAGNEGRDFGTSRKSRNNVN